MSRDRSTSRKPLTPGAGGKLANDVNQAGQQPPTQKNQGRRTPISRGDRQDQMGADNQSHARKGGVMAPGGGRTH
jgi:hypothetical protein